MLELLSGVRNEWLLLWSDDGPLGELGGECSMDSISFREHIWEGLALESCLSEYS